MKKILSISIVSMMLFLVTTAGFSQAFKKGDKLFNAGLGLSVYSGATLGASIEFGITDAISIGGMFDYAHYGYDGYGYSYSQNFMYFGGKFAYHFGELFHAPEKLDPYGWATSGFRTASYSDGYSSSYLGSYGSGIFFGAGAGARWYFNDKFAVFGEAGVSGSSSVRGGITLKF